MPRSIKEIIYDERSTVEADRVAMLDSLLESICRANGSPKYILDKIVRENMTVVELIDTLAQNKVRFVYVGDKK